MTVQHKAVAFQASLYWQWWVESRPQSIGVLWQHCQLSPKNGVINGTSLQNDIWWTFTDFRTDDSTIKIKQKQLEKKESINCPSCLRKLLLQNHPGSSFFFLWSNLRSDLGYATLYNIQYSATQLCPYFPRQLFWIFCGSSVDLLDACIFAAPSGFLPSVLPDLWRVPEPGAARR